jgi:DNA-binding GntR family transcriptional regulator
MIEVNHFMEREVSTLPIAKLGVSPVVRSTVNDRVHADLRSLLMRGRFAPGQPLTITELADAFGTSAQPVRDAICRLCAEKALETLPNRTTRVPVLDHKQLDDLRVARRAVEGLAAELGAQRASDEDVARLVAIVEREIQAGDESQVELRVRQNFDFHFALYRLSNSSALLPLIESLWLQLGPYIRQSAEYFDAREGRGAEFHELALDGLRGKDPVAVRLAIEQDIDRLYALVTSEDSLPARSAGRNNQPPRRPYRGPQSRRLKDIHEH